MNQMEVAFQRLAYEELQRENEEDGGIIFPFLFSKQLQHNRLVRAIRIATKKPPYVCYACTFDPRVRKYNGVWFSIDEAELENEGLVEVVYHRVKADIHLEESENIDGITNHARVVCVPNPEALYKFFEDMNSLHVTNKAHLMADDDLLF